MSDCMTCDINDLMNLFASKTFIRLLEADQLQFNQYVAAISLLIKNQIPFDSAYTPGNRRKDPEFTLTVYITPKTTMTISFSELNLTDSK